MVKTQLILLFDCSRELINAIERDGPRLCSGAAVVPVYLKKPPAVPPETGRVPLPRESVRAINRGLVLSCEYGNATSLDSIRHELQRVLTSPY